MLGNNIFYLLRFHFVVRLFVLHRWCALMHYVPRRGPYRSQKRCSFPIISRRWWICCVDQYDVRRRGEVSGIIPERAVGVIPRKLSPITTVPQMAGPSNVRRLVSSPAPRPFTHGGSNHPTEKPDPSQFYSSVTDRQRRTSLILPTLCSGCSVSIPLAKWQHLRDAKYAQSNRSLSCRGNGRSNYCIRLVCIRQLRNSALWGPRHS